MKSIFSESMGALLLDFIKVSWKVFDINIKHKEQQNNNSSPLKCQDQNREENYVNALW